MRPRIVFVTDPMCSWCWGMASDIERARAEAADRFDFDVLLGGINIGSTHPITDFARSRLAGVWRGVNEVTHVQFGPGLPAGDFVYNSVRACVAVEAVRAVLGCPPFDYVLRLQRRFFVDGRDVTAVELQRDEAVAAGVAAEAFDAAVQSPQTMTRVRDGFALAKSYGTAALPSVLLDVGGARRLVAGGFIDAPTLIATVDRLLA
ncbi:MAG TPA: DsbA family protein [Pseudomonadales bacterium]|nr:DsbA family protein [Pseudomonadales bacterium]